MNKKLNIIDILNDAPKGTKFGNDILSYMLNDKAMNENLNLVEILKDTQRGTKLWSPICGDCYFQRIEEGSCSPIVCTAMLINGDYCVIYFTEKGLHFNKFIGGECVLFPSKINHDWSEFEVPKKHKEFKPFQKVLIPGIINNVYYWFANLYSHYNKKYRVHVLVDSETINNDDYILPYEGNENKLGKPVE